MIISNLTPHTINVAGTEIPSHGNVRVKQYFREVPHLEDRFGFPIVQQMDIETEFEGLPDKTTLRNIDAVIVSGVVAPELVKRFDPSVLLVFVPDTSPESAIRDEDGRIVGVRRLRWVVGPEDF